MKWFKHMTCSYNDERLSAIVDKLGMEGYGFWWRLLEIVAEKLDETGDCSCSFSAKKWGNFFGFSAKKFEKFVGIFKNSGIFEVEFSENQVTINIHNLLKYRDEWSRKKTKNSGVTPEKLRRKDTDTDTEKEKEKKTDTSYLAQSDAHAPSAQPPDVPQVEPTVACIPLSDGTEFAVPESLVREYEMAYPGVNVFGELAKARAWCLSNPKQRKTRNGVRRFLNSWLDRAQNNATRASPVSGAGRAMTARQIEAEERGDFATQILKFDEAMRNGKLADCGSGTQQDICALSSAETCSRRI